MSNKEYLAFDLSFLDKKVETLNTTNSNLGRKNKSLPKGSWKPYAIFGGILLVAFYYLGQNKNTITSNNQQQATTQNSTVSKDVEHGDSVINGKYRCSRYHDEAATKLFPSNYEKEELQKERNELTERGDKLKAFKEKLEETKDSYQHSEEDITKYNSYVNEYNSLLQQHQYDLQGYDRKVDNYNYRIKQSNDYLITHCRVSR